MLYRKSTPATISVILSLHSTQAYDTLISHAIFMCAWKRVWNHITVM